jgi:hypothetical protein
MVLLSGLLADKMIDAPDATAWADRPHRYRDNSSTDSADRHRKIIK